MTNDLITLEQAKLRLRVDSDDQDDDISLMIAGASVALLRYLDSAADEFLDSSGDVIVDSSGAPEIPADVQNACLFLVGSWLRDPDGNDVDKWQPGWMPAPVVSLLASRRVPPLA